MLDRNNCSVHCLYVFERFQTIWKSLLAYFSANAKRRNTLTHDSKSRAEEKNGTEITITKAIIELK